MDEGYDLQAIVNITSEVQELELQMIFLNQCYNAQSYLLNKLSKTAGFRKKECEDIWRSNFLLMAEIKNNEQEIQSSLNAYETLRSANVDLEKELLLAKKRKTETLARTSSGKQKYEELWVQCKSRFERIPHIKAWMTATNQTQILKDGIGELENKVWQLQIENKKKRENIFNMDKCNIIALAEFMVHARPKMLKEVEEKSVAIKELQADIQIRQGNANNSDVGRKLYMGTLKNINEDTFNYEKSNVERQDMQNYDDHGERMPKLTMNNLDLDIFSIKLNEMKKIDVTNSNSGKNAEFKIPSVPNKQQNRYESVNYLSMFFKTSNLGINNKQAVPNVYSKFKLINILDDVKLNENDTYNILQAVKPKELHEVQMIPARDDMNGNTATDAVIKETITNDDKQIEEIDLTKCNEKIIIEPPTQFLDYSQKQVEAMVHVTTDGTRYSKSSQNTAFQDNKKKVSFHLPSQGVEEINNSGIDEIQNEKEANDTLTGQEDISAASDESYSNIKEMILKKNNLDITPPFIYAKNKQQMKNENKSKEVRSKFFMETKRNVDKEDHDIKLDSNKEDNNIEINKEIQSDIDIENKKSENLNVEDEENVKHMSFPKCDTNGRGYSFNHGYGARGITDSLNISMDTTVLEEGDTDFPHCVDSSLLLSPKADSSYPLQSQSLEVTSQDVPNFFSGFRKTGFSSFFSKITESKTDSSEQEKNNDFSFKFGGDEKKPRSGLFSMFH